MRKEWEDREKKTAREGGRTGGERVVLVRLQVGRERGRGFVERLSGPGEKRERCGLREEASEMDGGGWVGERGDWDHLGSGASLRARRVCCWGRGEDGKAAGEADK